MVIIKGVIMNNENKKIIIKLKDGSKIEIENFETIDFEDKSESEENKNFNEFQKTANSKLNWDSFKDEFEEVADFLAMKNVFLRFLGNGFTIKDLEVLIKNNFTDENGDIDISYLHFNGNVNMSHLKIDGDLNLSRQRIGLNLIQNNQIIGRNINQSRQIVGRDADQYNQQIGGDLDQRNQKIAGKNVE
jgi:hypothetical protein